MSQRNFLVLSKSLTLLTRTRLDSKFSARNFSNLVLNRNRLMHGNPHTALSGEQRLLYDGKHGRKDCTIDSMTDFSSRTATASIEAGELLHNRTAFNDIHAAKS